MKKNKIKIIKRKEIFNEDNYKKGNEKKDKNYQKKTN